MRIISTFRDYYDSIQFQGQDRSLIYHREHKEQMFKKDNLFNDTLDFFSKHGLYYYSGDILVNLYVIGFCGKIFPCFKLSKSVPEGVSVIKHVYSLDDVEKFVEANYEKKKAEYFFKDKSGAYLWRGCTFHFFKSFFNQSQLGVIRNDAEKSLFSEHPIFVARRVDSSYLVPNMGDVKVIFNPQLSNYNFEKICDPYTAFQELSMWVGNQANPEKPIPQMDDKTMLQIKGFDKWSFKKEPTKKK